MMRLLLLAVATALLAGCGNRNTEQNRTYDFGIAAGPDRPPITADIRPVESPEWLDRPEMLYRLAYRNSKVLEPYAQSRWAGTPAELLTLKLRQSLGGGADPRTAPCVLTVYLEEFSQVFEAQDSSRAILYARATLRQTGPKRGSESMSLRLEKPAPTPDAAGGASAFAELADEFARRVGDWAWASGYCAPPTQTEWTTEDAEHTAILEGEPQQHEGTEEISQSGSSR